MADPYARTFQGRQFAPPKPTDLGDEIDRTARQVRLDVDGGPVHQLAYSWPDPWSGMAYMLRCEDALTKAEGAILTTCRATCWYCLHNQRRPNR